MAGRPDLLTPVVPVARLHSFFRAVIEREGYAPARGMIREAWETFDDVDGNFIEQFQTTGLDSRTWELYWHTYLTSAGFTLDRRHRYPDFVATKHGVTVCIEAVTVAPTQGTARVAAAEEPDVPETVDVRDPTELRSIFGEQTERLVIKFASALYSKLQKRYWERPHVQGRPLILAIEAFHEKDSLVHSSNALSQYLYADRGDWHFDQDGRLVVGRSPVAGHRSGQKEIPSGFFSLPGSEFVSAVVFSNAGTIPKFARMGQQGRYHSQDVTMLRVGTCYDFDPNSVMPQPFSYVVGEGHHTETWGEELEVFLNPRPRVPIPEGLFRDLWHVAPDARGIVRAVYHRSIEFHPFGSRTLIIEGGPLGRREALEFEQLFWKGMQGVQAMVNRPG